MRRGLSDGYVVLRREGKLLIAHRLVAERALGKPLPPEAVVHHVNGDRTDNRPGNLVICQDSAYHNLLHRRATALKECGHASWRRCVHCGRWDDPGNMRVFRGGHSFIHVPCRVERYGIERGRPAAIALAKRLRAGAEAPTDSTGRFHHQRQKTHCPKGHHYSGENLTISGGGRVCRACKVESSRKSYEKRKKART